MELKLFVPNSYDKRMSVNLCKGFISALLIFKIIPREYREKNNGQGYPG